MGEGFAVLALDCSRLWVQVSSSGLPPVGEWLLLNLTAEVDNKTASDKRRFIPHAGLVLMDFGLVCAYVTCQRQSCRSSDMHCISSTIGMVNCAKMRAVCMYDSVAVVWATLQEKRRLFSGCMNRNMTKTILCTDHVKDI